jgi:death-on-curing protein
MRYLTTEEVVQINADVAGEGLLRDAGLLASAIGRPGQVVFGQEAYETLFVKVAALFESLALNHACVDGNKRTAVVAAIHMLNWNGYDLAASQDEIVDIAMDVVRHKIDVPKLAEFFQGHAVPLDYGEANE